MQKDLMTKDINFNKVLFLHINRIAMSQTQSEMDANVDILESLLFPYAFGDEKYNTVILEAKKRLNYNSLNNKELAQAEYTKDKFRALMFLAERKNLLLEKTCNEEEWNLDTDTTTDSSEVPIVD